MTDQTAQRPAKAYGQAQRAAFLPRQVEATAFAKAAALLAEAATRVQEFGAYRAALRFNRLIWTLIQADLARPDNGLSDQVKAKLLSLSVFVDKQTVAALAAPSAARLESLIEIDRNIAQGLLDSAGRRATAERGEVRALPSATSALSA